MWEKNLLGFYEWGPEVQRCYFQKSLLVFRCQIAHAYGMLWFFLSEDWARWQPVCSQRILTADVHAQKLWRNPKVWMVACLVNGRQRDHVGNVPFAYISHELGGWRQEQLDGLCLMQATFLKNFKFLKDLEVCVLALPVSTGKHDLASWPNVFFRWMRKVIYLMPLPVSVPYLKNGYFRVSQQNV